MPFNVEDLIEQSDRDGGIFLKDVEPGVVIQVMTQNSVYILEVMDPVQGTVMASGGLHLPVPERCHVNGSTWGGSMLRIGWIGVGMRLELARLELGKQLLTSGIRQVLIKRGEAI